MRSIADVMSGARPDAPARARTNYRRGSRFILDPSQYAFSLDRNARARLMVFVEGLERATKLPGRRCGALGQHGLAVLRCLVFAFTGPNRRVCNPSYRDIQRRTGFSRATIARAFSVLERLRILTRHRRLERARITRQSPITGELEQILTTIQAPSVLVLSIPEHRFIPLPKLWIGGNRVRRAAGSNHTGAFRVGSEAGLNGILGHEGMPYGGFSMPGAVPLSRKG